MASIMHERVLALVLVFVVGFAVGKPTESCETITHTNGCSTPLWLPMPYKNDFKAACDRHDTCYQCGEHYHWPQEDCDEGLKRHMYEYCKQNVTQNTPNIDISWKHLREMYKKFVDGWKEATKDVSSWTELSRLWNEGMDILKKAFEWLYLTDPLEKCLRGADVYHMAVRDFGIFAYMRKSPGYCHEKCASEFGDPSK